MKILFCGDVVGKSGRKVVFEYVPKLREKLNLDAVIVNGENAAHGFGLIPKMYDEFLSHGADIVTLGNHSFDKKEIFSILETAVSLVRPLNYPQGTAGSGYCIKTLQNGVRMAVVQLLGKLFMRQNDDPFATMDKWIQEHQGQYDILVVDYHAEATAEKVAFGWYMNGQATLVVGTHTHIPTADAFVMDKGTAYMTDVGMCGDYYSVIGQQIKSSLTRFLEGTKAQRLEPAEKSGTFCGVVVEIDDITKKAIHVFPVCIGAHLANTHEL
ncbi:MAG: TIGR00282 family metallophosphoesterase [Alphaproteobacteria bacterium]|nr:TIGR00282 family metallophosphoesterase [Alphaproteobacteria bacterium]